MDDEWGCLLDPQPAVVPAIDHDGRGVSCHPGRPTAGVW
jgi:hypothetical protein